ncbi:TetR/AcrR family transcriptional regulator [Chryseobacterium sp. CBSDS_008]|uniref:TetR/AcrR family transcriptional regulator n=1 Tax=Chryseobacterium sp. CBSDS_008 TaxID=3415265 RepID=UPI003CFA3E05
MRLKDNNKELIIRQEAVKMIVNSGFDGFSMQKLAKKAKISPSTIYVYFKNREDLVNQLYIDVHNKFEKDALIGFDAQLTFEEGLWLQWKNRLENILRNPLEYRFHEQFRNSPLISFHGMKQTVFRKTMNDFVKTAVKRKEIPDLPVEVFWTVAYGPFYMLVKFHLDQATMAGKPFSLTVENLRQTFELVVKALRV